MKVSYCLKENMAPRTVEIRDVGLGGKPFFVPLTEWDMKIGLPVEPDRIYFTEDLVFIHIRNGQIFKAFKCLLSARRSIELTPGLTYSIKVLRIF